MGAKLIFFEGADFCGKSTQLELTKQYLEGLGFRVFATRSPGGTPIASHIRNIVLDTNINAEEKMDYLARRVLYLASFIQEMNMMESIEADYDFILCDRFNPLSDQVYGYMLEDKPYRRNKKWALSEQCRDLWMDYFNDSHILENSVILLFQISNETANEREMFRRATSSKALDVNDEQDDSFKRKVNSNYNDIIEMVQDKRSRHPEKPFIMSMISDICIIDGNEGYMDVNEKVIEMLQQDIKTRMGDRNHD